jgi:uncharacterized membrane protein
MADLIAIGYDDEATAHAAAAEVDRLTEELVIQPDAVAVIARNQHGKYKVTTNHHAVGAGTTWGMFWALSQYGGKVLKSSLSKDAEAQLQEALHGTPVAA